MSASAVFVPIGNCAWCAPSAARRAKRGTYEAPGGDLDVPGNDRVATRIHRDTRVKGLFTVVRDRLRRGERAPCRAHRALDACGISAVRLYRRYDDCASARVACDLWFLWFFATWRAHGLGCKPATTDGLYRSFDAEPAFPRRDCVAARVYGHLGVQAQAREGFRWLPAPIGRAHRGADAEFWRDGLGGRNHRFCPHNEGIAISVEPWRIERTERTTFVGGGRDGRDEFRR